MPSRRRRQAKVGCMLEWTNEGSGDNGVFEWFDPCGLWIWPNEALTLAHTCPQLTAATGRLGAWSRSCDIIREFFVAGLC